MYLVIGPHMTEQMKELPSHSSFYGQVLDNDIRIFRLDPDGSGRFQRLAVVAEEVRPGYSRFVGEWRSVRRSEDDQELLDDE